MSRNGPPPKRDKRDTPTSPPPPPEGKVWPQPSGVYQREPGPPKEESEVSQYFWLGAMFGLW